MANAQSNILMDRARNHLYVAERMLREMSTAPAWATELAAALRCILDAEAEAAPAVMKSARKAQEGQANGKQ